MRKIINGRAGTIAIVTASLADAAGWGCIAALGGHCLLSLVGATDPGELATVGQHLLFGCAVGMIRVSQHVRKMTI